MTDQQDQHVFYASVRAGSVQLQYCDRTLSYDTEVLEWVVSTIQSGRLILLAETPLEATAAAALLETRQVQTVFDTLLHGAVLQVKEGYLVYSKPDRLFQAFLDKQLLCSTADMQTALDALTRSRKYVNKNLRNVKRSKARYAKQQAAASAAGD